MNQKPLLRGAALAGLLALSGGGAQSATIYWNTWTSDSAGSLLVGGESVAMTFSTSNFHADIVNYPSWEPASSYADGTIIGNAPVASNGIMQLDGGTTALNTLSFAKPITDPVVSIWSLGSTSATASFDFIGITPSSIVGGPSAEYGGSGLSFSGSKVIGNEGNGSVQFLGTYSSISWTNPQYEYWYGFNVGVASIATVPEPETAFLMLLGLAGMGCAVRLARSRARGQ